MIKYCNRFNVPPETRWRVQLKLYGGDPDINTIDEACENNKRFADWMRDVGRSIVPDGMGGVTEFAQTMVPEISHVTLCGAKKIDKCGFGTCAYVADYLCDYPVGDGSTCDLPICRQHAMVVEEGIHFCPVHYSAFMAKTHGMYPPKGYGLRLVKD